MLPDGQAASYLIARDEVRLLESPAAQIFCHKLDYSTVTATVVVALVDPLEPVTVTI